MEDIIGSFIHKGLPAGKFNPDTEVWSEIAVRVCVLRALKSTQPNKARTRPIPSGRKSPAKKSNRKVTKPTAGG